MSAGHSAFSVMARKISGFWAFSALAALVCMGWLLSIPTERYAGMPFGLSPIRLGLVAALLVAAGISLLLAALARRPGMRVSTWTEHARLLLALISLALAVPTLWLALLPASQVGGYATTLIRARPILAYLAAVSSVASLALAGWRFGWRPGGPAAALRAQTATLRLTGGVLLAGMALVAFMFLSGYGVTPDAQGWNTPSVPVTALQMLAVLLSILGLSLVLGPAAGRSTERWSKADTLLAVGMWLAAAILWNVVPLPAGFFAPGPYPPTNEFQPFSDAARFDYAGQFLLIGEGILGGRFTDRPVYMAFLALLRATAGQSYSASILLQVLVFAIAPAALYALGRRLHGRAAGMLLALLFILQERNTIEATRWLEVSHARWMMTEFPAMLLMLLALLAFVLAYRRRPFWPYLGLAGALLAAASMVRANPLFFFLGVLAYWFLTHLRAPRQAVLGCIALLAAFALCSVPWMLRTRAQNNITIFYLPKLENVIQMRFVEQAAPDEAHMTAPTPLPGSASPQAAVVPTLPVPVPAATKNTLALRAEAMARHSLHTGLAALFILPGDPNLLTLANTLHRYPYTKAGLAAPPARVLAMLLLNIAIISLGIVAAWRAQRWAGLAPLVLFLALCLSNGVARSSGGRYQVGVDWVLLVYFALGVVQAGRWFLAAFGLPDNRPIPDAQSAPAAKRAVAAVFALAFLLCAAPPLAELVIPQRPVRTLEQALSQPEIQPLLPAPAEQILQLARAEGSIVRYGRLLYPRFYYHDRREPSPTSVNRTRVYPRLVFEIISDQDKSNGVLPVTQIPDIPSGATALMIGCGIRNDTQVHTLIILAPGEPRVFTRDPLAPMACPIPEPVCDNNHNCR